MVDSEVYPRINGTPMWRLVHGSWSTDEPLLLEPQPPPEPGSELLMRIHDWATVPGSMDFGRSARWTTGTRGSACQAEFLSQAGVPAPTERCT